MKKNMTRNALVSSVIALLLCVSMLVGTTFAWFTDEVNSGMNTIAAGNLDVELRYSRLEGNTWTALDEVTEQTKVFKEGALYEPGYTEVVKFEVKNAGSLALQYTLDAVAYSEVPGVNVYGEEFKLSEYLYTGIVDTFTTREEAAAAADTKLASGLNMSGVGVLLNPGDTKEFYMVLTMPTTVDNHANYREGKQPQIELGISLLATQQMKESDSFGPDYDANAIVVTNAAQAQAALDNAAPGTTIQLAPGNYGTLYLRPYAGGAATKEVDWVGNNYRYETYSLFENVTIVGAEGATVDAIEIEGGTYYNTEHSQSATYPIMLSLVELKNVTIDGVTFTGKGGYDPQGYGNVINLSGGNIKVDGLTVKNCVLNNADNNARLIYKTESTTTNHTYTYEDQTYTFTPSLKDITVTGCTFNGGYMGLELRETENVTITNNTFNVADRNILLPVNTGCTYSGTITITGNVSNFAQERFVRADGTGDATVVITDNTLNGYMGADEDYIKVTNGNSVTVENNTLASVGAADTASLKKALSAGGTVVLANDIAMSEIVALSNANFVLDGNGHTITMTDDCVNTYALFDITSGSVQLKNATFDGIQGGAVMRTAGAEAVVDNITVQNGQFTQVQGLLRLLGKSTVTNSTFKNNTCNMVISLNYDGANNDPQVVSGCVFEGNTCKETAVVYYVKGAGATIDGNKFVNNQLTLAGSSNGATLYMGFTENNVITNNVFQGNKVTAGTSKRVAGALMIGYDAVITGNAFVDNTVTGTNAKGNDVCASVYYTDIDLSGNYWGGSAPVENDDYYVEYTNHNVIINDFLTTY